MKSGIYKMTFVPTGEFYVGSSTNLSTRRNGHLSQIKNGNHHSRAIRELSQNHGVSDFAFEMLEMCEVDQLNEREQSWIDAIRPTLNGTPTVSNGRRESPGIIKYVAFPPVLLEALEAFRKHSGASTDVEAMRLLLAETLRAKGFLA